MKKSRTTKFKENCLEKIFKFGFYKLCNNVFILLIHVFLTFMKLKIEKEKIIEKKNHLIL